MGTPIFPPPDPGNPCNACWGVGKTFGNYVTPDFVIATFIDVEAQIKSCAVDGVRPIPPVPDFINLVLQQDTPCTWVKVALDPSDYGWFAYWWAIDPPGEGSRLGLYRNRAGLDCNLDPQDLHDELYLREINNDCVHIFQGNDYTGDPNQQGQYGHGYVTWYEGW